LQNGQRHSIALMDAKLPHMHQLAKFVGAAYEEAAVQ
jgi:hypothetical protein